jgi:hypothetical protein
MKRPLIITLWMAFLVTLPLGMMSMCLAEETLEGGRTFISDRTGEKWDVTQAESIGFDPHGFQFGIGRDAIRPLDGSELEKGPRGFDPDAPVIGVENGEDAQAYVIRKLTRHEIANTELGGHPIAAAC